LNQPQPLIISEYSDASNPVISLKNQLKSPQSVYLDEYLIGLGAKTIIVEQNYFDRDYLDEFSAFYCLSAKGYPNTCKRVHFFSSENITKDLFNKAIGGDINSLEELNSSYLGFTVIRPIETAPFGRTVFKWYVDRSPDTPRVTNPSREYISNIAGIELKVTGLAWQQQDTGVAACATIGIWSMLHSSAFDSRHAIPTTSMITEAANNSVPGGNRVYPSYSLSYVQIQEAINQLGFSPAVSSGNLPGKFFSKARFANTCAAYIRSGYPLLIGGMHADDSPVGHAICAVGFREAAPIKNIVNGRIYLQDEHTDYIYIHDDNIGPNVRFKLIEENYKLSDGRAASRCVLVSETPDYLIEENNESRPITRFIPSMVITAVHKDLRVSSDIFFQTGIELTNNINSALNLLLQANQQEEQSLVCSTRFIMLKDYTSTELGRQLDQQSELLASTRLQLQENIPPMSLHLAILRIALPNASVLVDIIFDTTDTDRNRSVFCHVVFDQNFNNLLNVLDENQIKKIMGLHVQAF